MNNGYTETVSARVKPSTKVLMLKHNIQPRLAIEKGLNVLLSEEEQLKEDIGLMESRIRALKFELAVLEGEVDKMKCKLECLHSDEDPVRNNTC